ncbi:hypothetical protein [Microbacterium sp. NIBRBAC000506063]|uniref:hypothetical protein n=1 Tax=Microbacterium sp. NIBRBAC000506063 TaxID=2734618 RepID=UPI001BB73EE3|nr:hypothetical protein [Microbacterium sp. NIBRBAC000506063]QTV79485.1 hypothetical protein KAE78_11315 [Microbacterium sp. NIBRBAC000506063]
MELLVPADVEVAALAELSTMLPGNGFPGVTSAAEALGTKIPTADPKPAEFGRVLTTGGAGRDLVTDTPTLILEGYAVTEQRARDLCALMVAIVEAAARAGSLGGVTCYAARVGSLPSNLPHPQVPTHFRFTATVSVDLRRTTV